MGELDEIKPSRRQFLFSMSAITATSILPITISCTKEKRKDPHRQLDDDRFATIIAVQNHLFPEDKYSPGANTINAANYFTWVLSDTQKDLDEIEFMKNGIDWTNETADETYKTPFTDLNFQEKENVLQIMAKEIWGENWISVVLTFIFEALLSDPIYGSNNQESGWDWLEHIPGYPQPNAVIMYKPNK